MGFVFFRHKLNSSDLKKIQAYKSIFKFYNQQIYEIEIYGTLIDSMDKYVTCCDFHGEFYLFKKKELEIPKGSVRFILKPFIKNNKIEFYCKSAYKTTFYEELVFNLEINELKRQKAYKKLQ